ncbi:MAG: SDR family oxidoreductase [Candidatus Falkowbacteria bacterium]
MPKKNALIIGGTGGIGSAISKLLSENNIEVYAGGIKNNRGIHNSGKGYKNIYFNLLEAESVKSAIADIIASDEKLDIIINAAANKLNLKQFDFFDEADFQKEIDLTILGAFRLYKEVIPIMKKNKNGGLIINFITSTVLDETPPPRMLPYVTAKYGLWGLSRSIGAEMNKFGIKIYNIFPSFVETGLVKAFPEKLLEIARQKHGDKHLIMPENIAKLILDVILDTPKYEKIRDVIINSNEDIKNFIK